MAKKSVKADSKLSYRADCLTCGRYVGSSRSTEAMAEADKKKHLDKNGDHSVKIEVTQKME